ncbi:MAG: hypothetical protein GEU75_02305 [Dehalococcoidia bacterium]|nr:hypothetical protein [Dehalococcoidia bacterium]
MSLKTFVIVVAVLVVLFVFGLAGQACGGISSGAGFVGSIDSVLGAPHLKTDDVDVVVGGQNCIQGDALVISRVQPCTYELKSWLDRRLVAAAGVTQGVRIEVRQRELVTSKATFPPDDEIRAFIERKRSLLVKKETSVFTVVCIDLPAPPVINECRLPLN